MDRYTIYCTEAQTKKALELGAPLFDPPYADYFHVVKIEDGLYYEIPTAEQMCGWLEEQHIDCFVGKQTYARFVATVCVNEGLIYSNPCNSRKEATLAAIDAGLDYLINKR